MREEPRTSRGTATRHRLLDAAVAEFAERAIAGARVERITASARANKAQLYEYFGGKEGLFEEAVALSVRTSVDAVPFDADDLPGWAVKLYDQALQQPDLLRLIAWTRLERRPAGRWFDSDEHDPKLIAVTAAQSAGRVRAGDPFDLLAVVIAMASAWSPASGVYTASPADAETDHNRRRTLLRESVARVIDPNV